MKAYLRISEALEMGIWKDTHFFQSIGYPLILYSLKGMTQEFSLAMSLLQAMASSLTLYFMYVMVNEVLGKKVALVSLLISAVHVPWILYSNFALPELFFTFLLSLCGYSSVKIIQKKRNLLFSFLWAFSFILAFWLKGTHALWGPLFLLGLILVKRRGALIPIVLISAVVSIGLGAHGYLTYQKIGKVQLSASTGGLNFVEGKCPLKRNIDSSGYFWLSPLYYQLDLHSSKKWPRPFTDSSYFFKQGLNCIKDQPLVLIQSFESIPYLFFGNTLWPFNSRSYAPYVRFYELILAVFLIVGICSYLLDFIRRKNLEEFVVFVLPVISLFLCVYIFKSEMRYRIPFDIWFIPIAVKGWLYFKRPSYR